MTVKLTPAGEKLTQLTDEIYGILSGADHTEEYSRLTSEIYDWLADGDQGEGRTALQLAAEWIERELVADVA